MKRLLLDQGLPRSAAKRLQEDGWDVVHVGDIGMSHAQDEEILAFARQENRVCVTLDADFHALMAISGTNDLSVIRIRVERLDGLALADMIKHVWLKVEQFVAEGVLITVTTKKIRIRHFPFGKN
ncbi:MAG: DUF5615 family PIN-like protein [Magnetococcus sp. YQC-3]